MSSVSLQLRAQAELERRRRAQIQVAPASPVLYSEDDLRTYIRDKFGVSVPNVQVCPNHTTPWRAFYDAYSVKSPVSIWVASRGFGGKSFLLGLLSLVEALLTRADVNLLGGSASQSKNIHEQFAKFWAYPGAPRDRLAAEPNMWATKFTTGNRVIALAASQTSIRGPHVQKLRIDEADEMDIRLLDAALGQPMDAKGIRAQTVISSTHQHADGTMTEVLKRAQAQGTPVYEWCFRESVAGGEGWLSEDEVERKKAQVTQSMWDVEYELQAANPESRAINSDRVEAMFRRDLGVYRGDLGEYIEIEPPQIDAEYATGADWARKQDTTVIVTIRTDCYPWKLVAFQRLQRIPWPLIVAEFDKQCLRFPGSAAHDETGMGDVIAGYMTTAADGNQMVGRHRAEMLSNYIASCEHNDFIAPHIETMYSEHLYASVDDVYGSGHLPDTISAMANARTVIYSGIPLK